ncbi:DUF1223 domain-containing protein [Roseiterribacter gracilis]|uniref:Coproporphyrinogen III oxidase n=1 Tax=Roseiterribacter gracilis TaxID=2812848 RepID=A0A8S8XCN9_9PROT|nr:coproporphyrinogen III oxidase [Rhodospirillales bacterium TMPK1]
MRIHAILLALFAALGLGRTAGAETPVVVELFTSQGCSSCPPADAVLADLAKRPGVIALAWHVDYWNNLGWKDPYSGAGGTQRQRDYKTALKLPHLYTPQTIVQGTSDIVGTQGIEINRTVDAARKQDSIAVQARWQNDGTLAIDLPATATSANVRVVVYDRGETQSVTAGENAGRQLNTTHPVASSKALPRWNGEATTLTTRPDLTAHSAGVVVLLQNDQLHVLGAATLSTVQN